ncbi:MAG: radical SAM protein [Candidatus Omnitrophica bacterium]|nr:radical SAM protein [Candidatus Omnitrophota bacterium]MDD5654055.1 radical SAM protein [Candidatus Omnitrophota bacterium]
MKYKKVHICSSFNGCAVNSYLMSRIYDFLLGNGISLSGTPDDCDAVILGTCANVRMDEIKAMAAVKGYLKQCRGRKPLIVTGCLPDINPDFFKDKPGVITVGAKAIDELDRIFKARHPIKDFRPNNLQEKFCLDDTVTDSSYYQYYSPAKYYIEISRGCLNHCSYCAIKKAKGKLKSKPVELVIAEFRKGLSLGFKQFVLLGDECGGYGPDIGTDFSGLLKKISRLKGDFEIIISNLEPSRLIDMRGSLKDILPRLRISYINLPLQSGNDRILKLMNRNYRAQEAAKIVREIKKLSPGTRFETNFIYGFPSETRKEFLDSLKVSGLFDTVSFFIYSKRKGTLAAKLKGRISREEINYRTGLIKKLINKDGSRYYFADARLQKEQRQFSLKRDL